jgi:hypothetical protein
LLLLSLALPLKTGLVCTAMLQHQGGGVPGMWAVGEEVAA